MAPIGSMTAVTPKGTAEQPRPSRAPQKDHTADRPTGDIREFVLSRVANRDQRLLAQSEEIAANAVETLIAEGIEKAMAVYNGIDLREEEKDS